MNLPQKPPAPPRLALEALYNRISGSVCEKNVFVASIDTYAGECSMLGNVRLAGGREQMRVKDKDGRSQDHSHFP